MLRVLTFLVEREDLRCAQGLGSPLSGPAGIEKLEEDRECSKGQLFQHLRSNPV